MDILNNRCDFFNLNTTGMPYYDGIIKNNGNQYKHPSPASHIIISKNNPIKFILKYMDKDMYGKSIKRTMTDKNYINFAKVSKIMENMQNGIKYDTPIIDLVDTDRFQEGRHRVIAASNLGCTLIPVYVFGTEDQL